MPVDCFYWARAASRAYDAQILNLQAASYNPRGSRARKAWLDCAAVDASRKRMYRRFHDESLGQFTKPETQGRAA